MNPVRKRLKLSPVLTPAHAPPTSTSSTNAPRLLSQHALLQQEDEEEEDGFLLVEEDTTDSSLVITMEDSRLHVRTVKKRAVRRKRNKQEEDEAGVGGASESDEKMEEMAIDRQLDQSLETKSKQHNLTTVNVKNIIHEVITNEHVVAMMKAAINETEAVPAFEPKMTRSKLKEVVEKGVVIPAWNISPIKKSSEINKPPQFVDIPLAEEDSSDEEYRPDEEDEDETAEDTFQESDMESTASSPRGSRLSRGEEDSCSPWQASRRRSRKLRSPSVSMGPPPAPPRPTAPKSVTDSSFLEKLHAVEEELAVCMEPYQPLSESEEEVGLMAYRTRSKRPLRNVPLGQLEAELRAPDITPDMYDSSSTPEDREWTDWLRSLMSSEMDNEDDDDDDDPEYNFLAEVDEPDFEDYRDDKAVRITKKEVNELMEELFETLKEDLAGQEVEDEGHEEEEEPQEETQHTVEEQHIALNEAEENEPITELRTVRQQLDWIRRRGHTHTQATHTPEAHTLRLSLTQRGRLEQQLQQHVQLLTQIHLLTSPVSKLQSEAELTRHFLVELDFLSHRAEVLMSSVAPGFHSSFRSSNLQGALQLLEELKLCPISCQSKSRPPDARGYMRVHPLLPPQLAWIFCTRPVFLYPELLPCVSLDPALYCPRRTAAFTAAEDCLLVLGLRNMEGSSDPAKLLSHFLLRKTVVQVRRRILQCCRPGVSDNMVKAFRYRRVLWQMPLACRPVDPADQRPPVEREEKVMPLWLVRSLPVICPTIQRFNAAPGPAPAAAATPPDHPHSHYSFPPGTRYPPRLPKHLHFRRVGFVVLPEPLPPASSDPASPGSGNDIIITSTFSMATSEKILAHHRTLTGLRRSKRDLKLIVGGGVRRNEEVPTPPPAAAEEEEEEEEEEEKGGSRKSEEEEESEVLLALSESSSSSAGSVGHDDDITESESEEEGGVRESVQKETLWSGGCEDDDGQSESEAFAQDYLKRVCEAVQDCPGVLDQLLQVLDHFSTNQLPQEAELLYHRLSVLLRPWPQLLKDFAAFLNQEQAQRCGLLTEQQMFERSRRFLRRLSQRLGEHSALHQQVVSTLQRSPTLPPADMDKISSLLQPHPELQQLFQQLHATDTLPSVTHNPPRGSLECQTCEANDTGSEAEEEEEEVLTWTREEDRVILKACQQTGANQKTFTRVSALLANRSAHQVCRRFRDLMSLFQKSTSCSSNGRPISRKDAAPD